MEQDDRELAKKASNGDRKAFDQLVILNKDRMFALTYQMTGDRETALDLMQETFFAAFKELPRFRGDSTFSSWLYRIAANKSLNFLRRRKLLSFVSLSALPSKSEPSYDVPNNSGSDEMNRAIGEGLKSLPPKQKLVFNLRFYGELSFPEIALILKKSESTVKTNYQKALEKLRERLKDFR